MINAAASNTRLMIFQTEMPLFLSSVESSIEISHFERTISITKVVQKVSEKSAFPIHRSRTNVLSKKTKMFSVIMILFFFSLIPPFGIAPLLRISPETLFYNTSAIQSVDFIAQDMDIVFVVAGEEDGLPLIPQFQEQLPHTLHASLVQAVHWLVQDNDIRVFHDRLRDSQTLPHSQ